MTFYLQNTKDSAEEKNANCLLVIIHYDLILCLYLVSDSPRQYHNVLS